MWIIDADYMYEVEDREAGKWKKSREANSIGCLTISA